MVRISPPQVMKALGDEEEEEEEVPRERSTRGIPAVTPRKGAT
jgi:hypothetical protein